MTDSVEDTLFTASNVDISGQVALAIAKAHGLPPVGSLISLTLQFNANEPLVMTAQFYADPLRVGEVMASAAAQLQAKRAGHAA